MKKELLKFTVEQPKHRAHRVLFCENTPFKPKVVRNKKNEYRRTPKHRKSSTF